MARKYRVISADGHVETPPDGWRVRVPEKYRDRAPRLIRLPDGSDGWLVESQPMLHNGQNIKGRGPVKFANASYFYPDGTLREGAGAQYSSISQLLYAWTIERYTSLSEMDSMKRATNTGANSTSASIPSRSCSWRRWTPSPAPSRRVPSG